MTYEGLRLKVLEFYRKIPANYRRRRLKNTDFTIISNNCWGGMIYESYNLSKQSPTVGLFFMANDYIKFVSDLKGYLNGELTFIAPMESRWKNMSQVSSDKRFGSYPIGHLTNGKSSVEIFFLHYHSEQQAREKWERRCKRVNWDRILVKFNDQNCCTEKEIEAFCRLTYQNKIFFTSKHWPDEEKYKKFIGDGYCYIKQWPKQDFIMASYEPFGKNKYMNISEVLNNI